MNYVRQQHKETHEILVGSGFQEHVMRGQAGGFAQVCHGKRSLSRIIKGDYLIYYSPGNKMDSDLKSLRPSE